MQRCGGSPREISPSPRSGRENTGREGEREEGDWGNADWMGRNRIYEEARKQSGVDRGWGERERETEISTGSTPGLLLHVRVEIRVGLIRIGRWSRMEERVWGIFLIGWNSDSFQLRRKKKLGIIIVSRIIMVSRANLNWFELICASGSNRISKSIACFFFIGKGFNQLLNSILKNNFYDINLQYIVRYID